MHAFVGDPSKIEVVMGCVLLLQHSLQTARLTLLFYFKQGGLNSLPSVHVCRYISSSNVPKACLRSSEKKIPMSVEASTQPCLTPFLRANPFEKLYNFTE